MTAFEWSRQGLRLAGESLWLDARSKTPAAFVSHAHTDHLAKHEHVIATPPTLALMQHRLGSIPSSEALAYGAFKVWNRLLLECHPAGHVFGAAQMRVVRDDGVRLVYTGDVSLEPSLTTEQAPILACDSLVLEATFGHPRFRFPPRAQVFDQVAEWCRLQLRHGIRPIVLGYSLGKSQEAACQLHQRGLKVRAAASIYEVSEVYRQLGMPVPMELFEGELVEGEVGLFPPYRRDQMLANVGPVALAALTGWAIEPWGASRCGADIAFPISDHADFDALLRYAEESGAREVMTIYGHAKELSEAMRKRGIAARAMGERVQLQFSFQPGEAR